MSDFGDTGDWWPNPFKWLWNNFLLLVLLALFLGVAFYDGVKKKFQKQENKNYVRRIY